MDTGAQRHGPEPQPVQHPPSGFVDARRSTLVLGGAGTGKTIFALQALVSAAREGQPGLFAAIGHPAERVRAAAESFGWDLPRLRSQGLLQFQWFDGAESLPEIGVAVLDVARKLGARRVALDPLNRAALAPDTAEQTRELLMVRDAFFEQGLSAIFTCSPNATPSGTQCAALMRSLVDCAILLESRPGEPGPQRFLHVLRYRAAAPFPAWEFPFAITAAGIELSIPAQPAPADLVGPELKVELDSVRKRFSTGLHALDRFLEMKQAELDFLLEKAAEPGPAANSKPAIPGIDPFRSEEPLG